MKNILVLAAALLSFHGVAQATTHTSQPAQYIMNTLQQKLPNEVAAVLSDPRYAQLVDELNAKAEKENLHLEMTKYDVIDNQENKIVYFTFMAESVTKPGSYKLYGEIVAFVAHHNDSSDGLVIEGLYFKPAAEDGGGASVGN